MEPDFEAIEIHKSLFKQKEKNLFMEVWSDTDCSVR